jgi:membrane protein
VPNLPAPIRPAERAFRRAVTAVLGWPPIARLRAVSNAYNQAGGGLLAGGLAYGALFAGLTGLLFGVGVLGYLVPSEADRQRVVDGLTGQLAPIAPIAKDGLANVAAHAGTISVLGLLAMAWGASQFYVTLDAAIGRIFAQVPARGWFHRLGRGLVSMLLLVGGLLSTIVLVAVENVVTEPIHDGGYSRPLANVAFPLLTAVIVVAAVGAVYRFVPNTRVPYAVLAPPALAAGLAIVVLTRFFVFLAPRLVGALAVFGGFAAVFAALAWLSLAFQVLLLGAAWTHLRLEESRVGRAGA